MPSPIHRRHFLRTLLFAAASLAIPQYVLSGNWFKRRRRITIFHTNDFHSHIEPFASTDPKYPNQGGISRIYSLLQEQRNAHPHYLLLDCGDIMQGTPYFNIFGGKLEIEWMNKAGYHAATLGNHDFDNGMQALAQWITQAQFPFINCNYLTTGTPLQGLLKPYIIKHVNKRKIGITGVGIDPTNLVPEANVKGLQYLHPVEQVNKIAHHLHHTEQCDMIILLSHLGLQYDSNKISDITLAPQTQYIDLILGGHTHSFMPQPLQLRNAQHKPVIIHQVGWAGLKLGQLQFKI